MKEKLKYIFDNIDVFFATLFSGLMMVLLMLQVISRYVFNSALPWTEELALVCFILSIYFGASAAVLRKKHLRVEIVISKFSPKNRNIVEIFDNAVFFIFNCIISTGLYKVISNLYLYKNKLAITRLPVWIPYAMIPVILLLLNIRLIQDSINLIKDIKNGSVEQAKQMQKNEDLSEEVVEAYNKEMEAVEELTAAERKETDK